MTAELARRTSVKWVILELAERAVNDFAELARRTSVK